MTARALAERVYAALGAGDAEALRAALTDDFHARFADGLPVGGGEHDGPDAALAAWWALGAAFRVRAQPDEFVACTDGRLLVHGRYAGRSRADGRAIDAAFMHLWTLRGDRFCALAQLTDTARW